MVEVSAGGGHVLTSTLYLARFLTSGLLKIKIPHYQGLESSLLVLVTKLSKNTRKKNNNQKLLWFS